MNDTGVGPLSVEVIPFAMRFRRPYVTAAGVLARRESVLLRLRDENGLTGLGEGVPMSLRGGDRLELVVAELEAWADDPGLFPASAPARCAVSMAVADLVAKREQVPLWQYLDPAATPRTLKCNATITSGEVSDVVTQCETWAADGFEVFKLKAGPGEALELAKAVRSALGHEAKLRIDANGTWGESAGDLLKGLEPFGPELVEEPVTGLAELAALSRGTGIPLVADESVNDPEEAADARFEQACEAATVKLSKIGGLDASLGGHLPTYLSSALDGPVGIAAAAHVAQTLDPNLPWPGMAHGLATERLFEQTLSATGPLTALNELDPPANGFGLGVELDEGILAACRL
ncbi:MAG TPA: enolase C-terminal domain-like protein [Solirubrobacterales bacterium]|nr:enolase C-terminal domain-like protein [Solirubrobacterales bacterium]HNF82871.1 enolase C-terminal domain-like protein [Solirubrobacterales bacterium]